ncbi:hypothetical protein ALI22I_13150 [Saccharothrix sp. ALI-22-I]|nr:hypothetical protein ALI22I_13150 [Saccharothrix sp. ALI-22-I]
MPEVSAFAVPTFSPSELRYTDEPGSQPVPVAVSGSPGWMLSLSRVRAPSPSNGFVVVDAGGAELSVVVVVVVVGVVVAAGWVVVVTGGRVTVVVTTGGAVVVGTTGGGVVVVVGVGVTVKLSVGFDDAVHTGRAVTR